MVDPLDDEAPIEWPIEWVQRLEELKADIRAYCIPLPAGIESLPPDAQLALLRGMLEGLMRQIERPN